MPNVSYVFFSLEKLFAIFCQARVEAQLRDSLRNDSFCDLFERWKASLAFLFEDLLIPFDSNEVPYLLGVHLTSHSATAFRDEPLDPSILPADILILPSLDLAEPFWIAWLRCEESEEVPYVYSIFSDIDKPILFILPRLFKLIIRIHRGL